MNKLVCIAIVGTSLLGTQRVDAAPLKVRQVFTGEWHACAILKDRRVKCWGANDHGQLGLGDREDRGDDADEMGNHLPFVDLGDVSTVRQLALGRDHTCALSGANIVRCWGGNQYGQLGLEDTEDRGDGADEMGTRLQAIRVTETETITRIVAGSHHTCVLIEGGSVKCWGRNEYGQLGLGNEDNFGDDWMELVPDVNVDLGTGRHAVQIAAGYGHTCALLDDATVKCWGLNDSGQLGIGNTFERGNSALEMGGFLAEVKLRGDDGEPVEIDADGMHTCVLFERGVVSCWGDNGDAQLAQGHANNLGDDAGEMESLLPIDLALSFQPVSAIASGGFHNCALGSSGVKCWGMNISGQLGNAAGSRDAVGDSSNELNIFMREADLGNDAIVEIDAGWLFSCARFLNERIKCWGSGVTGALGLGDGESRGVTGDLMGTALPYIDLGNDGQR